MRYEIDVSRTTYAVKTFIVEASDYFEAQSLALEAAYNTEWKEQNAEYNIERDENG